jgi:AraC-like DNA-binding protein
MESFGYGRDGLHAGDCPVPLFLELEHRIRQEDAPALRKMLSICVEILTLAGGNGIQPQEQDLFERALQLIRKNYTDPALNVDFLLKDLGIHRSTLNRLFAAKQKCSPGELIRSLRTEHALELLRTTAMPVKEAAFASGFNDPAYFCRRIRKATGMTPEEIRKKKTEKNVKKSV